VSDSDEATHPLGAPHRLNDQLLRYNKLLHQAKIRFAPVLPDGVDWASVQLLAQCLRTGPRRQRDIATHTMLDPSTISRYVSQLVHQNLAERRADPEDGRAIRLHLTQRGREIGERIASARTELIISSLHSWSPEEITTLANLLTRFNDDLESRMRSTVPDPSAALSTPRAEDDGPTSLETP